jgi:hypothetical protein
VFDSHYITLSCTEKTKQTSIQGGFLFGIALFRVYCFGIPFLVT